MSRHVDKMAEKYNKPASELGSIGKALLISRDSDETVLINTGNSFDSSITGDAGYQNALAVIITVLKSFFKKGADMIKIIADPRFKIYTVLEIPKEYIEDYITVAVEEKERGIYFHLSPEETTGLQKYVPVINEESSDEEE